MKIRKRASFTPVFKKEVVRLREELGRPAAEIAGELGIPHTQLYTQLYKWQE